MFWPLGISVLAPWIWQAHTGSVLPNNPYKGFVIYSPLLVFLSFCVFEFPGPVVFYLYSAAIADAGHLLFRPFTWLLYTGLGFHSMTFGAICFIHCFHISLRPSRIWIIAFEDPLVSFTCLWLLGLLLSNTFSMQFVILAVFSCFPTFTRLLTSSLSVAEPHSVSSSFRVAWVWLLLMLACLCIQLYILRPVPCVTYNSHLSSTVWPCWQVIYLVFLDGLGG